MDVQTLTDNELISASAARPAEFALIFDRHFDAVFGYLQRRIGRDLAEELAAETFLVAFDSRRRYDSARSAADPLLDAFEGIEERIDASGERRRLVEGLAELSGPERDALLLAAWADLSYAEIAEALEVAVGTVRSRLSRARARIGSRLGGAEGDAATAIRPRGG